MQRRGQILGAVLAFAAQAGPAAAHHSLAGYDSSRSVELEAVVSEFHFTQPHPYLILQAPEPGAGPAPRAWRAEMDNLFELTGIGVTAATFRPGDRVQAVGQPMRDGTRKLYLRRLDRPQDGLRYEQVGSQPRLSVKAR